MMRDAQSKTVRMVEADAFTVGRTWRRHPVQSCSVTGWSN